MATVQNAIFIPKRRRCRTTSSHVQEGSGYIPVLVPNFFFLFHDVIISMTPIPRFLFLYTSRPCIRLPTNAIPPNKTPPTCCFEPAPSPPWFGSASLVHSRQWLGREYPWPLPVFSRHSNHVSPPAAHLLRTLGAIALTCTAAIRFDPSSQP